MRHLSIVFIILSILSCKEKETPVTAQKVVDTAIMTSCSGNCEHATIDFRFRDRSYKSIRQGGSYQFERITNDSTGVVRDVLTNDGFQRFLNDSLVTVVDSMAVKYTSSVNSVHYFVQLPFGLNAQAAHKELLGEAIIKDEPYYEIGVHFSEEGGGTDFEDNFVYWIHKENYTVDYLAYSYATDGGGVRFREAYNVRVIEGIRFVDYNNYGVESLDTPLTDLDTEFLSGNLKLLSKIETEEISVQLN